MSSSSSPSSSSTAEGKARDSSAGKRRATNVVWANWPSISIVLPPLGLNSRKVDEQCFTYCTQSVRGRIQHQEPSCRSICLRKVFRHEVRRAMSMHELQEAIRRYEKEHGRLPDKLDASVEVKYPLPPEGQRTRKRTVGPLSLQDASDGILSDGISSSPSNDGDRARHWKPGWYLWSTKSRWAVQEHIDMMSRNLTEQAEWVKYKEDVNETWSRVQDGRQVAEDYVPLPRHSPWFPDLVESTLLVPIPPPHVVIGTAIHKYLEPTRKLLSIVDESVQNGHQQELVTRMWEKALTPEPWILVRNVCSRMWKVLNDGPPDDDGEERNKGGKV